MRTALAISLTAVAVFALGPAQVTADLIQAGDDHFASKAAFTLTIYGAFTETLALDSWHGDPLLREATVHRDTQIGDNPGIIDTEIVALDLFGISTNVGPLHLRAGDRVDDWLGHPEPPGVPVAAGPSLGQITNVQTGSGSGPSAFISGDSFFDVFFEIDIPPAPLPGMTIYNKDRLRVKASGITQLPPLLSPYWFIGPVDQAGNPLLDPKLYLYMKGGNPNVAIGELSPGSGCHIPIPAPGAAVLVVVGLGLVGWVKKRLA